MIVVEQHQTALVKQLIRLCTLILWISPAVVVLDTDRVQLAMRSPTKRIDAASLTELQ